MAKSFSVLYVTSEIYPFAKVTPLADVAYSLPLALREIGHDMRVMLPKYGTVSERKNKIHEINRLKDLPIGIGAKSDFATVKSSSIANPRVKVQAYITTNTNYLDMNKGIYWDVKSGKEFPDNDERFIFFDKTVIETCLILGWYPDIIHVNDWQTALVAAYAKVMFPNKFKKTKIMMTVHDFSKQGEFPEETFDKTGFPKELKDKFMQNGKFNFLKAGLIYSDFVNTVSPTYAQEVLQDSKYTNDLNKLLLEKHDKFCGITNATDIWVWSPKNDNEVSFKYNGDIWEFKRKNRQNLLNSLEMEDSATAPLVGMVTSFDEFSGINMFIENADKILKEDIILILLGDGDPDVKNKLKKIAKKYPGKFNPIFVFDEILSHKFHAAADIIFMPSIYEPSAMNLTLGLGYATIPVARQTGAVNDVVTDFNEETQTGTAFLYSDLSSDAMISALKRALKTFVNRASWESLLKNNLNKDYSWEESAKKYDEIYRNLMKD